MKLTLPHRLTAELQQISQQISQQLGQQMNQRLARRLDRSVPLPRLSHRLKRSGGRLAARVHRSRKGLLGGLGLLLLWVWLWQWLLAVGVGLTVTVGLYLAQQGQLRLPVRWRRLWAPANRSLSLAVLGGLVALGSTYLATLLWVSESPGLAAGVLLQSYGLLTVLGLLLWQGANLRRPAAPVFPRAELTDLTDDEPLKRLIAVRQLTEAALAPVPALPASHLADCFRLMLDRETEPLVCSALLDGLQRLGTQLERRPARTPARRLQPSQAMQVEPQINPQAQPEVKLEVQPEVKLEGQNLAELAGQLGQSGQAPASDSHEECSLPEAARKE